MSWSLVDSTKAGSTGGGFFTVTTPSIDTSGADLIVVVSSFYNGGSNCVVTDNKGNTWQNARLASQAIQASVRISYCFNPTVGSGHTFTTQAANGSTFDYPTILVEAWSGAATAPLDKTNGATSAASGSTIAAGSVDPSPTDNELCIAGLSSDANSAGAVSIDSGFTISNTVPHDGSAAHMLGSMAHLVQTTAASANPTWNLTNNSNGRAAAIATFKGSAAAATFAATPAASATVTAALTTAIHCAATPTASGSATAALTTAIRFAAAPAGSATVVPALTTSIRFATSASATAVGTAALTTTIRFAAAAAGGAIASAGLTTAIRLVAAAAAGASATAALLAANNLAAAPVAGASVTALLFEAVILDIEVAHESARYPTIAGEGSRQPTISLEAARGPFVSGEGVH